MIISGPTRRCGPDAKASRKEDRGDRPVTGRPGPSAQVSCKITITKMMMTSTPIMVPIIPLFMDRPPPLLLTWLLRAGSSP